MAAAFLRAAAAGAALVWRSSVLWDALIAHEARSRDILCPLESPNGAFVADEVCVRNRKKDGAASG